MHPSSAFNAADTTARVLTYLTSQPRQRTPTYMYILPHNRSQPSAWNALPHSLSTATLRRPSNLGGCFFQMAANLKKLRALTLRMCKRFWCKQCCSSVLLILKAGLIRPATRGRVATPWCHLWHPFPSSVWLAYTSDLNPLAPEPLKLRRCGDL